MCSASWPLPQRRWRTTPGSKAVVVAGNERAFAAGADIEELVTADPADVARGVPQRRVRRARRDSPSRSSPRCAGTPLGGGSEVALACDLRVAGESARLRPECRGRCSASSPAGAPPSGSHDSSDPPGAKRAWCGAAGRHVYVPPRRRSAIGLVDRVVPDDEVEASAVAWGTTFAHGAVAPMALAKQAIDRGLDGPLAPGLDLERGAFLDVFRTDDAATGIRSFLDRGPGHATFQGR